MSNNNIQGHQVPVGQPAHISAHSHTGNPHPSHGQMKLNQQSPTMSPSPERKFILWNEFEQEEQIGGGSFGHVYRCRHIKTGKYYAVKKFKAKFQSKKKAFDQREIQILQRFDEIEARAKGSGSSANQVSGRGGHCPFVMKAERIEYENRKLYIVFEMMDMSLTQYIKKRGRRGVNRLDEHSEVKVIMKQILLGM